MTPLPLRISWDNGTLAEEKNHSPFPLPKKEIEIITLTLETFEGVPGAARSLRWSLLRIPCPLALPIPHQSNLQAPLHSRLLSATMGVKQTPRTDTLAHQDTQTRRDTHGESTIKGNRR